MTDVPMIDAFDAREPADPVAPQLRQAALTLHALLPEDRGWLLERLPATRRATLQALLDELAELGIPPDGRLVRDALAAMRPSVSPAADVRDAWAALARQSPETMAALLHDEPAGLVARVLAMRAWPWAEALLRSLEVPRRQRVEQLAHEAWAAGASIDAWLVDDLARRAAEMPRLDGGAR